MSIFDTAAGRAALDKVGYHFAEPYQADAEVAMMDWLAEKWRVVEVHHTRGCLARVSVEAPPTTGSGACHRRHFYEDTRAEALIAAVLATEGE